ncbi:MAG: hypothetical protein LBQ88_11695 [Treponema sp.]|jgi:hypothetical protein|nr:hypothetical protein [Treponema sp.]
MMKESPIIFSGPMVRAVLNTKPGVWPAEPIDPSRPYKCMTRRVIKPRYRNGEIGFEVSRGLPGTSISIVDEEGRHTREEEPRFWPGDILWVRETWARADDHYVYLADYPIGLWPCKMRPSIYMPREASRITLEVKDVRIERLREITPYDACCEGILVELPPVLQGSQEYPEGFDKWSKDRRDKWFKSLARAKYIAECDVMEKLVQGFHNFWDKLNAKRGYPWGSNPWVYVIEFMRRA